MTNEGVGGGAKHFENSDPPHTEPQLRSLNRRVYCVIWLHIVCGENLAYEVIYLCVPSLSSRVENICMFDVNSGNGCVVSNFAVVFGLMLQKFYGLWCSRYLVSVFSSGLGLNLFQEAVRVATRYALPLSSPVGAPAPSRRNIAVLSHAEYVPTLTSAPPYA